MSTATIQRKDYSGEPMADIVPSMQKDIQSSTQYAENERLLDPLLKREEDLSLSTHAKTLTFSTVFDIAKELHFSHYFSFSLPKTLAFFFAPQDFASHTSSIFSYQIVPAFGPIEVLEEKKKRLSKKGNRSTQEKKILEKMLHCLIDLEGDFSLFMGLRDHFQKG